MSKRFLVTRIPTVDEEEVEKFEAQLGRKPREGVDIEYTYAETVIDLLEVSAVRESYDSNKLMENEAVIYLYGESYFIQSPYKEVRDQWLELFEDKKVERVIDVADAVDVLCQALRDNEELYNSYQTKITDTFVDAFNELESTERLQVIATVAAKNFLDMLIKSTE
jgi:hypothetical protein